MKAAIFHGPNQPLTIEDVEVDKPQDREVLVKTAHSGVCHSDLHFIDGFYPYPAPAILGHEAAGIVEEVGPGVTGLAPGDRVIFSFVPSCGQCRACASGMGSICELGMYTRGGRQISDHTARHHACACSARPSHPSFVYRVGVHTRRRPRRHRPGQQLRR